MDKLKKNVRRNGIVKRKKERVKKDAGRTEKFQEKLSELLSYARNHENKVTMKEVRDFFEDFALDEQKVTFVCEYLTMEQVDVADYEPGVVPEETEKEKEKTGVFRGGAACLTAVS